MAIGLVLEWEEDKDIQRVTIDNSSDITNI